MIDVLIEKSKRGEGRKLSLVKTLSWRVVGTLDTIVISFLITGNTLAAFSIGSVEVITKMILYYFHERLWNRIK